jgi:hypothetical protein
MLRWGSPEPDGPLRGVIELPEGLARTLSTTNAIEFVNSRIRK